MKAIKTMAYLDKWKSKGWHVLLSKTNPREYLITAMRHTDGRYAIGYAIEGGSELIYFHSEKQCLNVYREFEPPVRCASERRIKS